MCFKEIFSYIKKEKKQQKEILIKNYVSILTNINIHILLNKILLSIFLYHIYHDSIYIYISV